MPFWYFLTNFGDSALLLPVALWIAAWLALGRAWRTLMLWCALFGGVTWLVALSKMAFVGWGMGIRSIDFTGVSGHTMLATAIYGTIAWLSLSRVRPAWRFAGVVCGIVFGAMIGVSRLMLQVHSFSETVTGFALGVAVCVGMIALRESDPRAWAGGASMALLLCGSVGLVAGLYGSHVPTQLWIAEAARWLSGHEVSLR